MASLEALTRNLRLPVIGAPMFRVSYPELVKAQCKAGIIGAFPALNARPSSQLREWIREIRNELEAWDRAHPGQPSAPFAVNLILNKTNDRLEDDLDIVCEEKVPLVITSLGARADVYERVKASGGMVLHDVTTASHARKAIEKGADGLILVCAGAGGHGGALNPFALVQEVRSFWDGPLVLSGAVANGRSIRAAKVLGCDLAYVGSAFIATTEAQSEPAYRQAVLEANAADIIYTPAFSGVPGNYLASSIRAAGVDLATLTAPSDGASVLRDKSTLPKAWKEIWAAGQGVGGVSEICSVADRVDRFIDEYGAVQ